MNIKANFNIIKQHDFSYEHLYLLHCYTTKLNQVHRMTKKWGILIDLFISLIIDITAIKQIGKTQIYCIQRCFKNFLYWFCLEA